MKINKIVSLPVCLSLLVSTIAFADVTFIKSYNYNSYGEVKDVTFNNSILEYRYDLTGKQYSVDYNGVGYYQIASYDSVTGAPVSFTIGADAHIAGAVAYPTTKYSVDLGFDQLGSLQVHMLSDETNELPLLAEYGFKTNSNGFVTKINRDLSATSASAQRQQFSYNYSIQGQLDSYEWKGTNNYHSVTESPQFTETETYRYYYDSRGNMERAEGALKLGNSVPSRTYDRKNRPITLNHTYDIKGRLIEDDKYFYKYNKLDRLALILDKETGEWKTHYLYDSNGHRVRKVTQDLTVYYERDLPGNLLSEKHYHTVTKDFIKKIEYVNANGINIASAHFIPVNGSEENVVQDIVEFQYAGGLQGSGLVAWTAYPEGSGSNTIIKNKEYSPFGKPLGDTVSNAYGYTGHEYDQETESHYMKARYYDDDYGRFNTPDPARDVDIFNPKSYNLYSYVGNNPINKTDPTGMLAVYSNQGAYSSSAGTGGTRSENGKAHSGGYEEMFQSHTTSTNAVQMDAWRELFAAVDAALAGCESQCTHEQGWDTAVKLYKEAQKSKNVKKFAVDITCTHDWTLADCDVANNNRAKSVKSRNFAARALDVIGAAVFVTAVTAGGTSYMGGATVTESLVLGTSGSVGGFLISEAVDEIKPQVIVPNMMFVGINAVLNKRNSFFFSGDGYASTYRMQINENSDSSISVGTALFDTDITMFQSTDSWFKSRTVDPSFFMNNPGDQGFGRYEAYKNFETFLKRAPLGL